MRVAVKRGVAGATAATVVAGVALAVMLWPHAERDINVKTAQALSGNAPPAARDFGNATAPPPAAATTSVAIAKAAPELDHSTLWRLCPSLWGDLSDDCMAALEARYAGKAAFLRNSSSVLPPTTPITWHQVYADPAGTRRIVADALRNPECMVPEGQVRPDLREVCAADAMTRYAILQERCGLVLVEYRDDHKNQQEWEDWLAHLDNDKSLDSDEYHRRRMKWDEIEFESAWHMQKCRAVESTVTAWLPELPLPRLGPKVRTYKTKTSTEFSFSMEHLKVTYDQSEHLIPAAARLGSEWALARTLDSVAHINAMAKSDLAMAYAGRARKVGWESDLYMPYFALAHFHAQLRGVPRHEVRLPVGKITEEQWQAAGREAERIVVQGWTPMTAAEIDADG